MQSAVRNRIASFEAQSNANGTMNAPASPASSHATNRSRRSAGSMSLASNNNKQRRDGTSATRQSSREPPGVSPSSAVWNKKKSEVNNSNNNPNGSSIVSSSLNNNNMNSSTSTTVAASENRKSRLRQSHHGGNGAVGGHHHHQPQPATNLLDKRKLIRERRLMQKQRRSSSAAVSSSHEADDDHHHEDAHGSNMTFSEQQHHHHQNIAPSSSARSVTATTTGVGESQHHNHANGNTTSVPDSPGRFAKFQRMTRRKGYDNVVKARNNAVGGSQQLQQQQTSSSTSNNRQHSSSTASATATNVTTGSSTATSLVRNTAAHRGSSSKTSPTGQKHSPNHTNSTHSSVRFGRTENEGQMSLENPTDDDATLTSVRKIMDQQQQQHNAPGGRNIHGSYDSVNSSNGGVSSSSWRPLFSRNGGAGSSRYHALNNTTNNVATAKASLYSSNITGGVWMEEEKSDKILGTTTTSTGPRVLRTASSSDYDTDGDISKTSRHSAQRLLDGPSHSQTTDVNDFFDSSRFSQPQHNQQHPGNSLLHHHHHHGNSNSNNMYHNTSSSINSSAGPRRIDDDERTFDYGDRDDDSNGSTSYATRRRKEAERRARLGGDNSLNNANGESNDDGNSKQDGDAKKEKEIAEGLPQLLSKEDMEKYTKTMENPAMKLGAGVVGVATVGCIAFGPVGLLVGVAAVGLGFGVMQIPEEERKKIQAKAEKAMHNLQEKAVDVSEKVSSNCLTTYKDSGVADHLPHCLSGADGDEKDMDSTRSENLCNAGGPVEATTTTKRSHQNHLPNQTASTHSGPQVEQPPNAQMKQLHSDRLRNKKVACLRNVRIMPVAQIHGLEPSAQPRAWLDIVASANTSNAQKNEAMEEILLLAKDKRRAKIFLDEGILDSIIWTLSRYFEKLAVVGKQVPWAFPDISHDEKMAANLAAQCCVTLGKAHCAAIHTEGDLQLMSMYERGTVPEERQVAQMLHEVPHHTRITKTNDPTIVEPNKEVFALRQLTLPEAEELAKSIKAVADGKL